MRIISHRGFWLDEEDKNKVSAFTRAFKRGFGVETDLRDYGSKIVISHDSPDKSSLLFDDFLVLYIQHANRSTLALNIKADCLQDRIKEQLSDHGVSDYFVFDMSIPDTLGYSRSGINFFARQSEIEKEPTLYEEASGIWLDCFYKEWFSIEDITSHLDKGKQVCIVSPELHGREHSKLWKMLMSPLLQNSQQLMLCTDYPHEAMQLFNKEE